MSTFLSSFLAAICSARLVAEDPAALLGDGGGGGGTFDGGGGGGPPPPVHWLVSEFGIYTEILTWRWRGRS